MWKRILIISVCVVVIVGIGVYFLLEGLLTERRAIEAESQSYIVQKTTITQIDYIDEYRGKEVYKVVIGKDDKGTSLISWFNDKKTVTEELQNGIPHEEINQKALKEYPGAVVKRIVPGLEGEQKLWEVTLLDKDKRYNYVYYDFTTGTLLRAYTLNIPKT